MHHAQKETFTPNFWVTILPEIFVCVSMLGMQGVGRKRDLLPDFLDDESFLTGGTASLYMSESFSIVWVHIVSPSVSTLVVTVSPSISTLLVKVSSLSTFWHKPISAMKSPENILIQTFTGCTNIRNLKIRVYKVTI